MPAADPALRDRVVDMLRVASLLVVVVWHWSLSITHWRDGELVMPNPLGEVPGAWAVTWVLQVMPVFFLVGGYVNLTVWGASGGARSGEFQDAARAFWRRRFGRLAPPVAVYVACWAVVDVIWQLTGGTSLLEWGIVLMIPLWFLGVYAGAVALAPWTAEGHLHRPVVTLVVLAAGSAVSDLVRFGLDVPVAGWIGSVFVWLFAHQLGYFWHDWSIGARPGGGRGKRRSHPADRLSAVRIGGNEGRRGLVLAVAGLTALVLLTTFGPYPASMVAVRGDELSNMFPTTTCIVALVVVQLGVVQLLRAPLSRWLERPLVGRAVAQANRVPLTVYCWHMTAVVAFLFAYEAAGFELLEEPTLAWWLTRPLWVVGPLLPLAVLVAVFTRFEVHPATPTPARGLSSGRG